MGLEGSKLAASGRCQDSRRGPSPSQDCPSLTQSTRRRAPAGRGAAGASHAADPESAPRDVGPGRTVTRPGETH